MDLGVYGMGEGAAMKRKTLREIEVKAVKKAFGLNLDDVVPMQLRSRLACYLLGVRYGYRAALAAQERKT